MKATLTDCSSTLPREAGRWHVSGRSGRLQATDRPACAWLVARPRQGTNASQNVSGAPRQVCGGLSRPYSAGRQHRHSQPTSAPKATISTISVSTATVMVALLSYRAIHIERQGKRHRTTLSLCGFRSTDSARSPRAQHRTCRRTWRTANTTEEYSCWSPHGRHQSERGGSGLTPQRVALGRTDCAGRLALLVAWSAAGDLLDCAKLLFVAAIVTRPGRPRPNNARTSGCPAR